MQIKMKGKFCYTAKNHEGVFTISASDAGWWEVRKGSRYGEVLGEYQDLESAFASINGEKEATNDHDMIPSASA